MMYRYLVNGSSILDVILWFRRERREQRADDRAHRHDQREDVELSLRLSEAERQAFNQVYQTRVDIARELWQQAPEADKETRRLDFEAALIEYKDQLDRQVGVVVIAQSGPLTSLSVRAEGDAP